MRKSLPLFLIFLLVTLWCSCRKDFEYQVSNGDLKFSKDTVFLDTVFTNIGSSTYTLKVYNRSNQDIEIPSVRLGEAENSMYRLNVDGVAGKEFTGVPILARDSIFIFIETNVDIAPTNQNEFLYTDAILFDSGSRLQQVPLVTLVRDAVFLYPSLLANGSKETLLLGLDSEGNEIRIEGFVLTDEQLQFTNEKPYVIYGYAAVADTKTLRIEQGTRVHFHKDSGIIVGEGGSVQINGALSNDPGVLENEVIFEGDRLEPGFSNIPGQWGTLWLAPGSLDNSITHLTIRNATVGILAEGASNTSVPTLRIRNSQIHNSGTVNLWAKGTEIEAENLVLGNAGTASLRCSFGGSYSFVHGTISNYWSNGFRSGAAVELSNFESGGLNDPMAQDLTKAEFTNCIIDGNTSEELFLLSNEINDFTFSFANCLLKFRDTSGFFADNPFYDFENTTYYSEVHLNGDLNFKNTAENDFSIGLTSDAIGKGNETAAFLVPLDIMGNDRTLAPDIGAYQHLPGD